MQELALQELVLQVLQELVLQVLVPELVPEPEQEPLLLS